MGGGILRRQRGNPGVEVAMVDQLTIGYDHASHDGDVSVLTIRKGNRFLGNLTGEAAEMVYAAMLHEEELLEEVERLKEDLHEARMEAANYD
jgi:hypothetical protein